MKDYGLSYYGKIVDGVYKGSSEVFSSVRVNVFGDDVKSLGDLKIVHGNLSLDRCYKLKSLGSLEYVGGNLAIIDCPNLKSLGLVEEIRGAINYFTQKPSASFSLGGLKMINAINIQGLDSLDYGALETVFYGLTLDAEAPLVLPPKKVSFDKIILRRQDGFYQEGNHEIITYAQHQKKLIEIETAPLTELVLIRTKTLPGYLAKIEERLKNA